MKIKKLKLFFWFLLLMGLPMNGIQAQTSTQNNQAPPQEGLKAAAEKKAQTDPGTITLDVKDADIRDIMRMLSQVSGLNFIISDDVKGTVTLSISDVPWEEALNLILRANNLTSVKEGKFLRIITFEKFRAEEEGVPLNNEAVSLNFAKAQDIISILDPLRSSRGKTTAHNQTNTIVITDTPENFKKMMVVIEKLDKRTPQVMIEALMLDVKLTDEEQLGIKWLMTDKERPYRTITTDLLAARAEGIIRYGKTILPQANMTLTLDYWAQNKKAEILANPKVLTMDGLTASIELTDEVPYLSSQISSTGGEVTTSAAFRETGIKLYVTPHISAGGFISLAIKTEQSFQSGTVSTTAGAQPVIDQRRAETNLLVMDGETIVIGGLRKKDTTKTIDKIPIMGDLPIIGRFFRRTVEKVINTELLIFVTPYIINQPELKPQEQVNLEKFRRLEQETASLKDLDKTRPFSLRGPK